MKRLLALFIVAAFLLAIPVSHFVWSKGHVPSHKEQVCHDGKVIEVGQAAQPAHLDHGDCAVPKDDFGYIGFKGFSCDCSNTGCPLD